LSGYTGDAGIMETNLIDSSHRCTCHDEPVDVIPKGDTAGYNYYCHKTGKQLFKFIHRKEINMEQKEPRNPEDTWPGDAPNFPDEEIGEEPDMEEPKEGETGVEMEKTEGGLTGEEEEQPFLFEGDKVYNALHTALTDVNEDIKKCDKALDNKKLEKKLLQKRKEELQDAIKIYKNQQSEKE
jgi:hypothetical protein